MKKDTPISINFTPRTLFVVLLFVAGVLAVWKIGGIILVIITAVILAAFVESISRALIRRLRLPRIVAVMLVYIVLAAVVAGLLYLFIPTLFAEIANLSLLTGETSPLGEALGNLTTAPTGEVQTQESALQFIERIQESLEGVSGGVLQVIQQAFGGFVNLILVVVISFYLSIEERGVEQFLRAITPIQHEEYVISVWRRTEYKIGAWFRGQLLQAVILGTLTYVGLWLFDVPYALMLSALAAVLGMIPFGIVLAGFVALVVAYTAGGVQLTLVTLLWYFVLQQIENYILQPLIINRVTGVPSVVVLLSVVVGAALFGFTGLIIGIPIAVVLMELIRDSEKSKQIEIAKHEIKKFNTTKK